MAEDLGTHGPVGDGCGDPVPKIQRPSPPHLRLLTGRAWLSVSSRLVGFGGCCVTGAETRPSCAFLLSEPEGSSGPAQRMGRAAGLERRVA